MAAKNIQEAQNPLILRCNRLIEAFAKSDDERDFFLDRSEGFIIYIDLDKPEEELVVVEKELDSHKDRYCMIPKLTFYETKKIMEGFINEKVYDIDTKEKLLDIIQSKEARENFLDFLYDHHSELEKWQTYYQERSRIRIIEWLRNNNFHFVFEEDLDFPTLLIEKVKRELFQPKASKEVLAARKTLSSKAKTYYSNEALNPRPKRGRPPKQALKAEIEPQVTTDIYTSVPQGLRSFLFTPDLGSTTSTFSSRFGSEEELFNRHSSANLLNDSSTEGLSQKLAALRSLSHKWNESESTKGKSNIPSIGVKTENSFENFYGEEEDGDEENFEEDGFDGDDDFDSEDDEGDDDLDFAPSNKSKKLNGFQKPSSPKTKSGSTQRMSTEKPSTKNNGNHFTKNSVKAKPISPSKPVKQSPKEPAQRPIAAKAKPMPKPQTKPQPSKRLDASPNKTNPNGNVKANDKTKTKAPVKKAGATPAKKPLRAIMKLKKKSK